MSRHLGIPSADELQSLRTSSGKRDQRFWTRRPLDNDAVALASLEVATMVQCLHPKMQR